MERYIQPEWFTADEAVLMRRPPDVHKDFIGFLDSVVEWISSRRSSRKRRNGLAGKVIRDANQVWCGVGVYTSSELFFMAGMVFLFFQIYIS